jgi:hypothetical protein
MEEEVIDIQDSPEDRENDENDPVIHVTPRITRRASAMSE